MKKIIIKSNKYLPGHPWIFENTIDKIVDKNINSKDIVHVYDKNENFIGTGFYNKNSDIRIRIFSKEKLNKIEKTFFYNIFKTAFNFREKIFKNKINNLSCRIFFSESDGFSGLTIDKYNDIIVIQITSLLAYTYIREISDVIVELLSPNLIFLKSEKKIKKIENLDIEEKIIYIDKNFSFNKKSEKDKFSTVIEENNIKYKIYPLSSQKTGFYFDQKENRIKSSFFADGKNVLDLFCYTGGFGFNCLKGKANSVISVDSSKEAIDIAMENKKLNKFENITFVIDDVFKFIKREVDNKKLYDLIILDPPKMTHTKSNIKNAIKGYINLNYMALKILKPASFMITSSCTGRISLESFIDAIMTASIKAERKVKIIDIGFQAGDHPILLNARETHYLKCLFLYVE